MDVRPLSARSIVLSLMLAVHPPEMTPAQLVASGEVFDVPESTLRAALTRPALDPPYRPWDGTWETAVVVAAGRSAPDRAALRQEMERLRLAELREGVWTRPANLDRPLPTWPDDLVVVASSRPMDERGLTARLWDLPGWTDTGARLLTALDEPRPPVERLAVAAALVRHLRTDPALSPELRPSGWNAPRLVEAYAAYQTELAASLGRPSPVRDTAR